MTCERQHEALTPLQPVTLLQYADVDMKADGVMEVISPMEMCGIEKAPSNVEALDLQQLLIPDGGQFP